MSVPTGGRTVAALAVVLVVAGCGGSGGSGRSASSSSTSTGASTTTKTATTMRHRGASGHRRGRQAPHGPPVGARQAVTTGGAHLTVTVTRVLALARTGAAALPGTRQVGVQLRIANQAGATYDSTASGDVSIEPSKGAAEPLDVRTGVCTTQLVDFESHVYSGSVRDGCVAFSLPVHARVLAVRFSPHSRAAGTLTWRVGR